MPSTYENSKVEEFLNHYGLDEDLQDEMLDHLWSHIEKQMILGKSFDDAFLEAKNQLPHESLISIQKNKKRLKFRSMIYKNLPYLLPLFLGISLVTVQLLQQEAQWQEPFANQNGVRLASHFGFRTHPIYKTKKMHTGIDFTARPGTHILPVLGGKVIEAEHSERGFGNRVKVEHSDGYVSFYAHLADIYVSVGDLVTTEDTIGTVGNSGMASSTHLHLEIIKDGKKINPAKLFPQWKEKSSLGEQKPH